MAAQTEALAKVDTLLKELWQLRDAFYASDAKQKNAAVAAKIQEIVTLIPDGAPKARAAYLKGRALDAVESYSEEANQQLKTEFKAKIRDALAKAPETTLMLPKLQKELGDEAKAKLKPFGGVLGLLRHDDAFVIKGVKISLA